jgi:hypothetical protein
MHQYAWRTHRSQGLDFSSHRPEPPFLRPYPFWGFSSKELERENMRLKKIVAQQVMDIDALKELARKNW